MAPERTADKENAQVDPPRVGKWQKRAKKLAAANEELHKECDILGDRTNCLSEENDSLKAQLHAAQNQLSRARADDSNDSPTSPARQRAPARPVSAETAHIRLAAKIYGAVHAPFFDPSSTVFSSSPQSALPDDATEAQRKRAKAEDAIRDGIMSSLEVAGREEDGFLTEKEAREFRRSHRSGVATIVGKVKGVLAIIFDVTPREVAKPISGEKMQSLLLDRAFLYENDDASVRLGFLKSEHILRTVRCIVLGVQSTVEDSTRNAPECNAARWGLLDPASDGVTPGLIAFAACVLVFLLSDDPEFKARGQRTNTNYFALHTQFTALASAKSSHGRALRAWYNDGVFPDRLATDEPEQNDDEADEWAEELAALAEAFNDDASPGSDA